MDFSATVTRSGVKLNAEAITKGIVEEIDGYANAVQKAFRATTSSWNSQPVFEIKKTGEYERIISTAEKRYSWLNDGTSVRYVVMTQDFIAKSQANSLSAGPGRGGVLGMAPEPRPGITARNFAKKIKELYSEKSFAKSLELKIAAISGF